MAPPMGRSSGKPRASPPTVLDLFSGAGGMALGFQAAGARCVGAVDIDPVAAQTFRQAFHSDAPVVFGGRARKADPGGDLTRMRPGYILERLPCGPDIVVGGPPCQSFSLIGRAKLRSLLTDKEYRRGGGSERNELYQLFLDLVVAARPKAFVMENVPALRGTLGVDIAQRIAEDAERRSDHLYEVRYVLLNAAWYGVPQQRWRVFFLGLRRDLGSGAVPRPPMRTHQPAELFPDGIGFPEDPHMIVGEQIPTSPRPHPIVTVHEALQDLPRLVAERQPRPGLDERLPFRRAPTAWATALRDWPGLPAGDTVSGNWYRLTPRDFEIFRQMAHGDRYPQAIAIAEGVFRERLDSLRAAGKTLLPGGRAYRQLRKDSIPPYRNDAFKDKWAKLHPDRPSWTLTAHLSKDSYSHIHYDSNQARTITIREAARLQSFPDGFAFCGSPGDQFRQIGNAVPPLLARAIAENLLEQIAARETPTMGRRGRKAELERLSV
jgi:DNA (cytosine-5)-methyltransferase 1